MSRSFDFILAGASLIVGILLLTGHGDFFMKGGNAQTKMAKGSGVALILIGIVTLIDSYTTTVAAKIGYIVVLVIIMAGLMWYLKKKCMKN